MIRILILLLAFNTIFAPVNIASACMPDKSSLITAPTTADTLLSQTMPEILCDHCDDMASMSMADCDSQCNMACTPAASFALLPSLVLQQAQITQIPHIDFTINFFTRSLSPELQPPLV